jgi:hypothetical protein
MTPVFVCPDCGTKTPPFTPHSCAAHPGRRVDLERLERRVKTLEDLVIQVAQQAAERTMKLAEQVKRIEAEVRALSGAR